jgi:phosphocarrier protein HPr
MLKREIEIANKLGLHARASAKLTQTAGRFQSDVFVIKGTRRVNAKSIMGVMMLAASKGTKVELEVDGADQDEAMEAVVALINDKFGEGE